MVPLEASEIQSVLDRELRLLKDYLDSLAQPCLRKLDQVAGHLRELDGFVEDLVQGVSSPSTLSTGLERELRIRRSAICSDIENARIVLENVASHHVLDRLQALATDLRLEGLAQPSRRPGLAARVAEVLERAAAALRARAGVS